MPYSRTITEQDVMRLAREIARDLEPVDTICRQFQLTADDWTHLQNSEIFQTRLVEEAQLWSASTKMALRERIATKAALAVEDLLLDAIGIVRDPDIPGAARVQALQYIAKIGHLGEGALTKDDGSGRVVININLGEKKLSFAGEYEQDGGQEGQMLEGTAIREDVP